GGRSSSYFEVYGNIEPRQAKPPHCRLPAPPRCSARQHANSCFLDRRLGSCHGVLLARPLQRITYLSCRERSHGWSVSPSPLSSPWQCSSPSSGRRRHPNARLSSSK